MCADMDEQEHLNGLPEQSGEPDENGAEQTPGDVSAFRNAWEISAAARRKEELAERERQKKEAEAQYQAREEYAKTLAGEKVDLIRLKQGVISEEDMGFPEEEEKHYTRWQRFCNWFYHAKWWLGIAGFCVILAAFLIYDYIVRVDPDLCIMLLTDNPELAAKAEPLCRWLEQNSEDFNEDGKTVVQAVYIPVSEQTMEHGGTYASAYNSQLLLQFQSATCMLVLADSEADKYLKPDEMFTNLERIYADCPFIEGQRLYLEQTDFPALSGTEVKLNPGSYLALRQVRENMSSPEENQEAYDRAKQVMNKLVPLLHGTEKEQNHE